MFACIYVPDFPAEAIMRAEPLLRERAVAVLEGKSPLVHVVALNEKARLLGMNSGMTKLQAAVFASSAGHSSTVLRQRSANEEYSAHSALLDIAHAFTPRVEDTAADTLLLDLAGLERLYGAYMRMAHDLAARVSEIGLEPNIALAANPDAAMYAARGFSGVTVIPAGKEAQRLGALPLAVLWEGFEFSLNKKSTAEREREKVCNQILDSLEGWGVRDFRALAILPEHALASRLGDAGTRLQRLARGTVMRTLVLCEPPSRFEETMELESPVETIESLSFILNWLLEQLCARMRARTLAIQELCLHLQLEHRVADEETLTTQELTRNSDNVRHNTFECSLRLPVAMRDSKMFLKLLQLELAAHPPGAPVSKVSINAKPALPRAAQYGLFLPISPEAEKLEVTLARINSVVGERRAGIARLLDSHRPDSFCMERFVGAPERSETKHPTLSDNSARKTPLALRHFRPACRLQVELSEERPAHLRAVSPGNRVKLQGRVLWSVGPWRSSGNWWTQNANKKDATDNQRPWNREEWDVALANQNGGGVALYRIYRDLTSGYWFADACYD